MAYILSIGIFILVTTVLTTLAIVDKHVFMLSKNVN